jgi:hypothetical protein
VEEEKKVWKKMKDMDPQAVKLVSIHNTASEKLIVLVKKFQNYIIVDF